MAGVGLTIEGLRLTFRFGAGMNAF